MRDSKFEKARKRALKVNQQNARRFCAAMTRKSRSRKKGRAPQQPDAGPVRAWVDPEDNTFGSVENATLNGNSQKRVITSLTADELKYTNPASTAVV
jgi:hypothetical protein